jgi:hypothetical protein
MNIVDYLFFEGRIFDLTENMGDERFLALVC